MKYNLTIPMCKKQLKAFTSPAPKRHKLFTPEDKAQLKEDLGRSKPKDLVWGVQAVLARWGLTDINLALRLVGAKSIKEIRQKPLGERETKTPKIRVPRFKPVSRHLLRRFETLRTTWELVNRGYSVKEIRENTGADYAYKIRPYRHDAEWWRQMFSEEEIKELERAGAI